MTCSCSAGMKSVALFVGLVLISSGACTGLDEGDDLKATVPEAPEFAQSDRQTTVEHETLEVYQP